MRSCEMSQYFMSYPYSSGWLPNASEKIKYIGKCLLQKKTTDYVTIKNRVFCSKYLRERVFFHATLKRVDSIIFAEILVQTVIW